MEEILRKYSKIVSRQGISLAPDHSTFYNYFVVPLSADIFAFANLLFLVLVEISITILVFVLQFIYHLLKSYQCNSEYKSKIPHREG